MNSFENIGVPSVAKDPNIEQSVEELQAKYSALLARLLELHMAIAKHGENTDTEEFNSSERRDFGFREEADTVEEQMDAVHGLIKQRVRVLGRQTGAQGALI